jgi:hypothetical protein
VDLQDDFALIRRTLDAAARPEPVVRDPAGPAAPSAGGTAPSPVGDEQMELF